jgi:hypothetical protein
VSADVHGDAWARGARADLTLVVAGRTMELP